MKAACSAVTLYFVKDNDWPARFRTRDRLPCHTMKKRTVPLVILSAVKNPRGLK